MIISKNLLARLSPSLREATPQTGDGTVEVPSLFSLTGLPPEPMRAILGVQNTPVQSSSGVGLTVSVSNGAQAIQNFMIIGPGWWRLTGFLSGFTNHIPPVGNAGACSVDIILNPGQQLRLALLYGGVNIPQVTNFDLEIMIRENSTIRLIVEANGVGQTSEATAQVTANKLL